MKKRPVLLAVAALALGAPAFAQTAAQTPPRTDSQTVAPATYDVATIRPADPKKPRGRINSLIQWGDNTLTGDNVTISFLLTSAFDARMDQISGQPGWANDQHYDISAKLTDIDQAEAAKLTPEQHRALIRALLVERFGLKYHEDTRIMPSYDLLPAKGGLKLKPAVATDKPGDLASGSCAGCLFMGSDFIRAHQVKVEALAGMLANLLQRNVADKSGSTEKIDVDLKFAPEMGANPDDANLPPLPTALEEQMGLHLLATRGPVKTFVIDHLDKPSEN